MGPKKGTSKRGNETNFISIDDSINTDNWRCVVVMAVEKSSLDGFILKEFSEEACSGRRRREVALINYEHFVLKIIDDFANGELDFKYSFLLRFSAIFQEAAEYVKNKLDIPVSLLVKVVKALLFFFREESLLKIEKKKMGPQDPVEAMSKRPANLEMFTHKGTKSNPSKKERSNTIKKKKTQDQSGEVKVRPPSMTKEETKLLKRGEGAQEMQCIDDSPFDGYFNLYVLLIGFYDAEFPMELVKAQIPLHGLLCIDTTLSGIKRNTSSTYGKFQKRNFQPKCTEIKLFWHEFLKILWNPELSFYFKDVIFQVYSPRKLLCKDKELREFIYREISYLMYDLSDYKRQHLNYLKNMRLWNVTEKKKIQMKERYNIELDDLPNECLSVPIILQFILDIICGEDGKDYIDLKSYSFDTMYSELSQIESTVSQSVVAKNGSSMLSPDWSQTICESGNFNTLNVYSNLKDLDFKYNINEKNYFYSSLQKILEKKSDLVSCCIKRNRLPAENIENALNLENGIFGSYWKQCKKKFNLSESSLSFSLDYCLFALLLSKMTCQYEETKLKSASDSNSCVNSTLSKTKSSFEIISNLDQEMRKPHFTVTDCSRSVLKCIPYNLKETNRDFFCPQEFKIVTPEKVKVSSAPELHAFPHLLNEISFISDLAVSNGFMAHIEWDVYKNIKEFLGNSTFSNLNGFDMIEELSRPKLLEKEYHIWSEYNCVDYAYSVLADSLLVVIHNKKDNQNSYHEAFNCKLRTRVGLRDFFEYILEDESNWFSDQEKLHKKKISIMANKTSEKDTFKSYADSDFWLEGSIKQEEHSQSVLASEREAKENKSSVKKELNEWKKKSFEKPWENPGQNTKYFTRNSAVSELKLDSYYFEGYEVENEAVQFSGLKTIFYADDCFMTVNLIEKLYGNQDLGIHVNQGGHILYLYSYVCPEPHVLQPYTFHLTFKNGVILAFGKRFIQETEELEDPEDRIDLIQNTSTSKVKATSSDVKASEKISTKTVINVKEDEEFAYDLKLSFPNGLMIEALRKVVKPCYMKQHFLSQSETSSSTAKDENRRLFLPNGDLVKISKNEAVQIFKMNTSIVTASLSDLTNVSPLRASNVTGKMFAANTSLIFTKYEIITSCGKKFFTDQGEVTSSKTIQIFQNMDIESNQMFFRRTDGTNYVIQSDGTLCVQFKDGTKMSNTPFLQETRHVIGNEEEEQNSHLFKGPFLETDLEKDFVIIYQEITFEHPNYATMIYNTETEMWKIILPFGSVISVGREGNYLVEIDGKTELKIDKRLIQMNRFSNKRDLVCEMTADLTVFQKDVTKKIYCKMRNSIGDTYVVEANSNSYLQSKEIRENVSEEIINSSLIQAQSAGTNHDQTQPKKNSETHSKLKGVNLSKNNKYFVVRKDITGFQVLHVDDFKNSLTEIDENSVVYTQELSCPEKLRCFVLISPLQNKNLKKKKWEMDSILPNPKFIPNGVKKKISSTYGCPPSWMHPFPKRKNKFQIPDRLTCKIFVEINRTEFSPQPGKLDCSFCELPDSIETEQEIQKIEDHVKKLSGDDQVLLKALYIQTARKILNEKKKMKPINTKKLKYYLETMRYQIELQEYHKRSIRYNLIPNYFHHPAGISWLIINDLIRDLRLAQPLKPLARPTVILQSSSKSVSTFSNDEIEYDLTRSTKRSYSNLSCLTNISSKTAPVLLARGEFSMCKIQTARNVWSAPATYFKLKNQMPSDENFQQIQQKRICEFNYDELDALKKHKLEKPKPFPLFLPMTLKNLMSLGLI